MSAGRPAVHTLVMDACFRGGDSGHVEQVQNFLRGIDRCAQCIGRKQATGQCSVQGIR